LIVLVLLLGLDFSADVRKLGDPRPHARRQARQVLFEAGDRAVPALLGARASRDPDVRREVDALLDRLFERSLKKCRYRPYEVPDNKWTRQLRSIANVQSRILDHRAFFTHFERHYRGSLKAWKAPARADYDRLLRTLARHVRRTGECPGPDAVESIFAVHAILWKVEQLAPRFGKRYWTTRWVVQRELLPALRGAFRRRHRTVGGTELDMYRTMIRHVEGFGHDLRTVRARLAARASR